MARDIFRQPLFIETAKRFPAELMQTTLRTGADIAKQVALTPVRVGADLVDTARVFSGRQPNLPISHVYQANQAVKNASGLGAVGGVLQAAGGAVLDAAALGAAAQGLSQIRTRPTSPERLLQSPESVRLYRGEGPANQGGIHFTPDRKWAKQFGSKIIEGSLPPRSRIHGLTNADLQQAYQQGYTSSWQLYKSFFDRGYDAVMRWDGRALDVAVNPATKFIQK